MARPKVRGLEGCTAPLFGFSRGPTPVRTFGRFAVNTTGWGLLKQPDNQKPTKTRPNGSSKTIVDLWRRRCIIAASRDGRSKTLTTKRGS
jgi:hypothetical protein